MKRLLPLIVLVAAAASLRAQDSPPQNPQAQDDPAEKWNLLVQATSIGQHHQSFRAAYSGDLSLVNHAESEASITTTLFFGWRPFANTQLYFDPEIAGGRAFSGTNGMANFPNGEMPRVASAAPKPYLARLYVTQDFGFGDAREQMESDQNQLGGWRPMTRYSITVGRFTVTDFFDANRYSHDPRTQFMGWGIMYNGAWDYPADTRGYTWGWVHEFHARSWSVRYASVAEPRVANGLRFDRRLFRDRGDVFEGELRGKIHGHDGAVRVLHYRNHTDSGSYADAIRAAQQAGGTPDAASVHKAGTLKYGFGLSGEQEIAKGVGLFGRLGWSDGKTESFAFTAIDNLATVGVSVPGERWHRKDDTAASEVTSSGLASIHRQYLERGGMDFLIGDGRLNYGRENIWESYYAAKLVSWLTVSLDVQRIWNPAYNRDRGPLWAESLRLHIETGKK